MAYCPLEHFMSELTPAPHSPKDLIADLRRLIAEAQHRAAVAVNVSLTALYWHVGRRIGRELLHGDRGVYGEALIGEIAGQLTGEYGRGFTHKTYGGWCSSPKLFRTRRLSPHCGDN
jgi:hypothetical protein